MTPDDYLCALAGVPLLAGFAFVCERSLRTRAAHALERDRAQTRADAAEAEYRRRDVRAHLARLDLPRD